MKKIIITISSIVLILVGWLFYEKPIPPFGAVSPVPVSNEVQRVELMAKRNWNSKTYARNDGKVDSEFKISWINYLDANFEWKEIDTTLVDNGSFFTIVGAPFQVKIPKSSLGTAQFISDNRWDVFNKKRIDDAPFTQSIKALGVASVTGVIETGDLGFGSDTYVIYKNAYPSLNADLIYYVHHGRAPRLKKIVRFNVNPNQPQDIRLGFELNYSEDLRIEYQKEISLKKYKKELWNGIKITTQKGISHKPNSALGLRGIGLKDFTIWDSGKGKDYHRQLINVEYEQVGLGYNLIKIVPTSFLNSPSVVYPVYTDTVSTFYPDPSVEVTSVDGRALRDAAAVYSTIHDGAGTASDDVATNSAGVTIDSIITTNQYNGLIRGFLLFDTSSIPDGDSVSAAVLTLQVTAKSNQLGGDSVRVVTTTPASNTAIVDADYTQTGTAAQATDVAISGITIPSATEWTFNATGRGNISKTSISKFGIRLVTDADNTGPTWAANESINIFIDWADKADTTTDPKLVVTHAVGGAKPRRIIIQ